jgi:uncharacterized Zn finger protein (UPF0148 family)
MAQHLAVTALQQISLQCACCRQLYRPARMFADAVESVLFERDPYVICPICEMNVPADMRHADYKLRCRRVIRLTFGKQEYKVLMALSMLANHTPTPERDSLFNLTLRKAQIQFPDKTWPELKQLGDALWKLMGNT